MKLKSRMQEIINYLTESYLICGSVLLWVISIRMISYCAYVKGHKEAVYFCCQTSIATF